MGGEETFEGEGETAVHEFERAKECEDHGVMTESPSDGREIAIAFKPSED